MSCRLFLVFLSLFVFLLPLKFGNPIVLESVAVLPRGGWEWGFANWSNQLGLLGAMGLLVFSLWTGKDFPRLSPRVFWLPCAFLASQLAAVAFSVNLQVSIDTVSMFVAGIAMYVIGLQWGGSPEARFPLRALLVSTAIIGVFAIEQYFGGFEETRRIFELYFSDADMPEDFRTKMSGDRAFATFVYPNSLAGYVVLVLPVLVACVWELRRTWEASAMWVTMTAIAGLALFTLVLSGSKGGFVALVGTVVVALFVVKFPRRMQIVLAVILALCALGLALRYGPSLAKYGKGTASARVAYWIAGVRIFDDHPLLGTGPGTFGCVYPKYKLPTVEDPRLAHNNFLEALSDSGVPGFVAYTALWVWPLVLAGRRLRTQPDTLSLGLFLALVAWVFHGLVDFDQYIPSLALLAFFFLGSLEARFRVAADPVRPPAWLKVMTTLGVLILCVIPVRRLEAQRAMEEALRLHENSYAASAAVERAIRWVPLDAFYHFKLGMIEAGLGRASAIDCLHRAQRLDPHRSMYLWTEAELIRRAQGPSPAYFAAAEAAVALSPENPSYHKQLAEAYGQLGLVEKAKFHQGRYVWIQLAIGRKP